MYLASIGILLVDVDGSTVPMTMNDYLIDSAWNIDTLMAVISSRQLPDDFKYDEYIENSKCTVDILAFEETKPTNEAMDLDEEENKKKRSRGSNNGNKNEDSQKKMSLDDLSDSDKDENTTIAQIAEKSKADSFAPPKSDSKPPSLSKSKVLWEPPKFAAEIDMRVKQ